MKDNLDELYLLVDKLVAKVESLQGCKAVELMVELTNEYHPAAWPDVLTEAIAAKKVVEIEYVLPSLDFRVKSFILPIGTEITIK